MSRLNRVRRHLRGCAAFVLVLLLAGCATAPPYRAPAGLVWGSAGESTAYPGVRLLLYRPTRIACEDARAEVPTRPANAFLHLTFSECRELTITAGSEYWVSGHIDIANTGTGVSTRAGCESTRSTEVANGWAVSACAPVSVRFR
jgi:hypothetical protein